MARPAGSSRGERGVVLLISLVALVVLSLAGIAFMKSIDTGNLVAGNLAFSRAAVAATDAGAEAGRAWIQANAASLQANQPPVANGQAYWAIRQDGFDPRNYNWTAASATVDIATLPLVERNALAGYTVQYVIHRMCRDAGDPVSAQCLYQRNVQQEARGADLGVGGAYQRLDQRTAPQAVPYFRITTRVIGPRNTEVYVQVMSY